MQKNAFASTMFARSIALCRVPVTLVKPARVGSSAALAATNGGTSGNGSVPAALENDYVAHLGQLHFTPGGHLFPTLTPDSLRT